MPHSNYISPSGEIYPSATELTSLLPQKWLWSWYKQAIWKHGKRGWQKCKAQSNRGLRIGTETHALLESFITKKPPEYISGKYDSQAIADALYDKVNPLVDEYTSIEPHLISEKYRIHGTADMIVRLNYDTGLWVGDWKTAAGRDMAHPIQLAIYAMCWNEMCDEVLIDKGFIARVDKKSKKLTVHIDEYKGLKQYYPVVLALREIYEYSNKLGVYGKPDVKMGAEVSEA
jgi:hypothetical protein